MFMLDTVLQNVLPQTPDVQATTFPGHEEEQKYPPQLAVVPLATARSRLQSSQEDWRPRCLEEMF